MIDVIVKGWVMLGSFIVGSIVGGILCFLIGFAIGRVYEASSGYFKRK